MTGDGLGKVSLFRYPAEDPLAESKRFGGHSSHVTNVRFAADRRRVGAPLNSSDRLVGFSSLLVARHSASRLPMSARLVVVSHRLVYYSFFRRSSLRTTPVVTALSS